MTEQEIKIGETYKVVSQRKGTFFMKVTHQDDTWDTGIITKGYASAMLSYNVVDTGEEVTVRKSFTTFTQSKGE